MPGPPPLNQTTSAPFAGRLLGGLRCAWASEVQRRTLAAAGRLALAVESLGFYAGTRLEPCTGRASRSSATTACWPAGCGVS